MNQQKLNEGRKARAAARRETMLKLAAQGKTNKQISAEVGVAQQTVQNNLSRANKEPLTLTEERAQSALDELAELKEEVKSHRKGNKPLPLAAVDRLIKIAEVVMRLEGTAAPTKSISANVNVNPEHSEEYLLFREACAGLSDEQKHDVRMYAKALPRTWVAPPIEANFPPPMVRQLEADNETI